MNSVKKYLVIALVGIAWSSHAVLADDTEIFNTSPTLTASTSAPNVLIILDNTSNWNTQFDYEMTALKNIFGALSGLDRAHR